MTVPATEGVLRALRAILGDGGVFSTAEGWETWGGIEAGEPL